jgi:hypothetical protein
MAQSNIPNSPNSSDEIDLGQLFQMIGNGFRNLFKAFLRLFLYLKKNAIVLIGLIVLGAVIGFGLNKLVSEKMKIEVIVKPNLESKNYLYDVVDEIQANIKTKETSFFQGFDIDIENLKVFDITIEAITNNSKNSSSDDEMKYLELLQNFDNSAIISEVIKAEILTKTSLNHRIVFTYKEGEYGYDYSKKLIQYINSNTYYNDLVKTNGNNARERIQKNEVLLSQIDVLISNYSNKIGQSHKGTTEGNIILDNEEKIDITGLFSLKNGLIYDIEAKKLELVKRSEAISIINFGRPQQVQKSLFGKNIVIVPIILIGLFLLFSFIKYLNKQADNLSKNI